MTARRLGLADLDACADGGSQRLGAFPQGEPGQRRAGENLPNGADGLVVFVGSTAQLDAGRPGRRSTPTSRWGISKSGRLACYIGVEDATASSLVQSVGGGLAEQGEGRGSLLQRHPGNQPAVGKGTSCDTCPQLDCAVESVGRQPRDGEPF